MQNLKGIFSTVTLFLFIVFMSSCGGSSGGSVSSSGGTRSYSGTASPGDVWTWTLNFDNNTFTGVSDNGHPADSTYQLTLSGSIATQASGLLLLTVSNVSGGSNVSSMVQSIQAGIASGTAKAYGIEAPKLAFLVKPISGSHVISSVYLGTCDSVNGNYNWIRSGFGTDADVTQDDAYGTVSFSGTTSSTSASITGNNINGGSVAETNPPAASCSNGVLNFSDQQSNTVSVIVSSSGGFVIDFGQNNGGVIGFKQNSLALSDIGNKTYIGFLFKSNTNTGAGVEIVKGVFSSATSGSGYSMDPVTGNQLEKGVTLSLSSVSNGLVTGTITDLSSGNTKTMYAATYQSGGKTVLFMLSADGGDNKSPYNVLVVSQ